MRIIQLIQKPQLRGAEIFACQLSDHLLKRGNKVLIVTIFNGDAILPFSGKIIHLNRPLSKRFWDVKGWREFNNIIKTFKPDVIQANASDTLKFAVSSKKFFQWKIPLIFRNANKMGDFIRNRFTWALNNFYVSNVDLVISVSKECEKDFRETFNYPKTKIRTVQIGVEEEPLGDPPADVQSIFSRGPVVTHVGGFVPEKNHLGLLRIFQEALKNFPDLQLVLVGKGKLEESIKKSAEEMEIIGNIHFLGYRKDVLRVLHNSKAFVLPSLIEGLPAVILESMYCRTPVIAYNVGGIGEIVRNNDTGWLVPVNDEAAFQQSLNEVLLDNTKVEGIVVQAQHLIRKEFMNTQIAEKFLQAYKTL